MDMQPANEKAFPLKKVLIFGGIYAALIFVIVLIVNLTAVNDFLTDALLLFRPVLLGLVIAYLCNPVFRFLERRLFFRVRPISVRRVLALLFSYLFLFLVVATIIWLIIPQLLGSIVEFLQNYDSYLKSVIGEINDLIAGLNSRFAENGVSITELDADKIQASISDFLRSIGNEENNLFDMLENLGNTGFVGDVTSVVSTTISVVSDIIFALFISLYLLNSKERRYAQIMRLRRALFSDRVNEHITRFCRTTDRSFGDFIRGKLLDSLIVFVLFYLIALIFGVTSYPLMIAAIVSVTNIIPLVGPIIGIFTAGVIILLSAPSKLLLFLILAILVEIVDSNLIGPRLLGDNNGVSTLCVLIAITTLGYLWGLVGMLLAVPIFATVIELCRYYLNKRADAKGIPESEESKRPKRRPLLQRRLRKLEKSVLHLRTVQSTGTEGLTEMEKLQLDSYALACKYQIFSDATDEKLALFAAEEAAIVAAAEADKTRGGTAPENPSDSVS